MQQLEKKSEKLEQTERETKKVNESGKKLIPAAARVGT